MAFISNFCSINSLGLKVSSQSPILFLQQKPKTKKNFFMKLSCSEEKTIREQINKIIYKNRILAPSDYCSHNQLKFQILLSCHYVGVHMFIPGDSSNQGSNRQKMNGCLWQ